MAGVKKKETWVRLWKCRVEFWKVLCRAAACCPSVLPHSACVPIYTVCPYILRARPTAVCPYCVLTPPLHGASTGLRFSSRGTALPLWGLSRAHGRVTRSPPMLLVSVLCRDLFLKCVV